MPVGSPVSDRATVVALLMLTFATGLVDAISVLVLGHVFVANMTGNVVFLGFWLAPKTTVDMAGVMVSFASFLIGAIIGGRYARHLGAKVRIWLATALGTEVVLLAAMAALVGTGVLDYHTGEKFILIACLAITFGAQSAAARQFGVQELSTTVLTSTIVGMGVDSRLAGGTGEREKLRITIVLTLCLGAAAGATLLRIGIAPVIGLAACVVAAGLAVFLLGPPAESDYRTEN